MTRNQCGNKAMALVEAATEQQIYLEKQAARINPATFNAVQATINQTLAKAQVYATLATAERDFL